MKLPKQGDDRGEEHVIARSTTKDAVMENAIPCRAASRADCGIAPSLALRSGYRKRPCVLLRDALRI